jgi:creatinine amidohydrolase
VAADWRQGDRAWFDQFDREQMHANWGENFPWNRLPGVELPAEPRPAVPLELITQLDARRIRAALPDGMMGGAYAALTRT